MRVTLATLGLIAFAQAGLAVGCVDGVTPNCSDPAARCEPSADASFDRAEVATDAPAADTSSDTSGDALPDALADADLDAGDEI